MRLQKCRCRLGSASFDRACKGPIEAFVAGSQPGHAARQLIQRGASGARSPQMSVGRGQHGIDVIGRIERDGLLEQPCRRGYNKEI
jgi:hypothetical protein